MCFSLFSPGIETAQFPKIKVCLSYEKTCKISFAACTKVSGLAAIRTNLPRTREVPVVEQFLLAALKSPSYHTTYRCAFSSGLSPDSIEIHVNNFNEINSQNQLSY
jgi:hypothetical protein